MQLSHAIAQCRETVLEVLRSRGLILAAAVLLPYAGVLIGLDVAARYGEWTNSRLPYQLFLSTDDGFGEFYEYGMTVAVSVLLFLMWRRDRELPYLANSFLFAWLTLDNAVQIHEEAGGIIAPLFSGLTFIPVAPNQIGEAFFLVLIGAIWFASLLLCLRASNLRPVIYSLMIAGCIAGTAVFGVVADFIDSWGPNSPFHALVGNFIEDGGEFLMIVLCLIVTVAIYDTERDRRALLAKTP